MGFDIVRHKNKLSDLRKSKVWTSAEQKDLLQPISKDGYENTDFTRIYGENPYSDSERAAKNRKRIERIEKKMTEKIEKNEKEEIKNFIKKEKIKVGDKLILGGLDYDVVERDDDIVLHRTGFFYDFNLFFKK